MTNLIDVTYQQTGKSLETDQYGMREMQRRAFVARNAQYLLLKAPPASGKSRALMFLGLDKLYNHRQCYPVFQILFQGGYGILRPP
jgi:hypothetical protein